MQEDEAAGSFFYVLQDDARILFVDDDPIMREFAAVHLATDKGEVILAQDGLEALEIIAASPPDIVLMDLEMPRMDGFEALQRLRSERRTRDLPVIVVTGRDDVVAIDRAFQAGATSFLVKPINWRLLSYQIRYVLRSGRHAQPEGLGGLDAEVRGLAREGVELVRRVLETAPDLRRPALSYGARLAETLESVHRARPGS